MDACSNAVLIKRPSQTFPVMRTYDIQVIYRFGPGGLEGSNDRGGRLSEQLVVPSRSLTALRVPVAEVFEFCSEKTRLDRIQPSVVALEVVLILLCLSVISELARDLRQVFVIRRDRTGFAAGTQVLARVKAECRGMTH